VVGLLKGEKSHASLVPNEKVLQVKALVAKNKKMKKMS